MHRDGLPAAEPRVYMAAACGCAVLTESLGAPPQYLQERIIQEAINYDAVVRAMEHFDLNALRWCEDKEYMALSTDRLLNDYLETRAMS